MGLGARMGSRTKRSRSCVESDPMIAEPRSRGKTNPLRHNQRHKGPWGWKTYGAAAGEDVD